MLSVPCLVIRVKSLFCQRTANSYIPVLESQAIMLLFWWYGCLYGNRLDCWRKLVCYGMPTYVGDFFFFNFFFYDVDLHVV